MLQYFFQGLCFWLILDSLLLFILFYHACLFFRFVFPLFHLSFSIPRSISPSLCFHSVRPISLVTTAATSLIHPNPFHWSDLFKYSWANHHCFISYAATSCFGLLFWVKGFIFFKSSSKSAFLGSILQTVTFPLKSLACCWLCWSLLIATFFQLLDEYHPSVLLFSRYLKAFSS